MKRAALIGLMAWTAIAAHGGDLGTSSDATGAVIDVSARVNGAVGYESSSFSVNQSAGSVVVTAVRGGGTQGALSVTYSTLNQTAVAGSNYTAQKGTLTWASGDGADKKFTVPIDTSNVFSGTKNFVVKMDAGPNTLLGAHTTAYVTITGGTATSTGYDRFSDDMPAAGSDGTDAVPSGAGLEDTSHPTHVIGNGTAASCTSAAVVAAVKSGGIITFDCGDAPVTIPMTATARLFNDGASKTVIDGGGRVTLSGMKQRRILYMNTCDESLVWTSTQCNNQEYPQLTVQNITFSDGNASSGSSASPEGGAIYASGGRLKVVNSRFFNNSGLSTGITAYGGAIFAFQQYQGLPVYVIHSTFGGEPNLGNTCANGGALGSIATSWYIVNSLLTYNHATGSGGNPPASGTPGGGSGGAFYDDGYTFTLTLAGSTVNYNSANEYGAALTFILDNATGGSLNIKDSTIMGNTGGTWYPKYPQISEEDNTPTYVTHSTIVN